MRFGLSTLFYAVALLAAGMATFGGAGVFATIYVAWLWWFFLRRTTYNPGERLLKFAIVGAFGILLFGILFSTVSAGLNSVRRVHSHSNLKQLALGLHNYESAMSSFPKAALQVENSTVKHSWRLAIGPFLESNPLWWQYDRTKTYDSPTNRAISDRALLIFHSPAGSNQLANRTNYFAVVGPDTIWDPSRVNTFDTIEDPSHETILVIEAGGRNVPWAKPEDLTLQEAVDLLTGRTPEAILHGGFQEQSFLFDVNTSRVNVAMLDGSTKGLPIPLDESTARALLTASGGEKIRPGDLRRAVQRRLNYRRVYGLVVFIGLSLLPGLVGLRRKLFDRATRDLQPA